MMNIPFQTVLNFVFCLTICISHTYGRGIKKPKGRKLMPRMKSDVCKDLQLKTSCDLWKQGGYCTNEYKDYMMVNCKKTCQFCGPAAQSYITDCKDLHKPAHNCWSWKTSGYCEQGKHQYYLYMTKKCMETCGLCKRKKDIDPCTSKTHNCAHKCINTQGGFECACDAGYGLGIDKESCFDINECILRTHSCDQANGECVNTKGSYLCKCKFGYKIHGDKKTCSKDEKVLKKPCKNRDKHHKNCPVFVKNKFCEPSAQHYGFMKDNCALACGFCECKDKNTPTNCKAWKGINYCTEGHKFYGFMKDNCKRTCGFCGNDITPASKSDSSQKLNMEICGMSHPIKKKVKSTRIVGGEEAAKGEFPWIIGIAKTADKTLVICGGSLITSRWILSAAHCFKSLAARNPNDYRIRLGEHDLEKTQEGEQVVEIDQIKVHEDWDPVLYNNDMALLRLKKPVKFGRFVSPICIPNQSENFAVGKNCTVAGWGQIGEKLSTVTILQKVTLPLVDHKLCTDTFLNNEDEIVTNQMICSGLTEGGKDSCQGDSGGPLFCLRGEGKKPIRYQVGVVSWGVGCARKGLYGVYARVSSFRTWIENNIK